MIYIPPNMAFILHAHPNIEYDYVAEGEFYGIRCKHDVYKSDYCNNKPIGPDISNLTVKDFFINKSTKGHAVINDIGSIHLSFTKSKPCMLYCLWSGLHANIPNEFYPKFLINFHPENKINNISYYTNYIKNNKRNTKNNNNIKNNKEITKNDKENTKNNDKNTIKYKKIKI